MIQIVLSRFLVQISKFGKIAHNFRDRYTAIRCDCFGEKNRNCFSISRNFWLFFFHSLLLLHLIGFKDHKDIGNINNVRFRFNYCRQFAFVKLLNFHANQKTKEKKIEHPI